MRRIISLTNFTPSGVNTRAGSFWFRITLPGMMRDVSIDRMRGLVTVTALLLVMACGSAAGVPGGSPLSVAQLKFAVIDAVGQPVYCDPDFYPVARQDGEQENADAYYAQIRADAPLYAAIVAHEHLSSGELNQAQKVTLYRAFKLLRALALTPSGDAYVFQIRVESQTSGSFLLVDGTVRSDGRVDVTSRKPTGPPMCPICLAATTLIDTPGGAVRVTSVRPGMLVWTIGARGERAAARVLKVGSTPVPATHLMVDLVLADGRELLASPGHRTADGRALGTVTVGDE